MRRRISLTVCTAAVLIAGIATFRPYPIAMSGMDSDRLFWSNKKQWAPEFSLIVAGDSRVYRGVAPAAMSPYLPRAKIGNFGFSAAALTSEYLRAAAAKLNASARVRILAIGISPYSLTTAAAKDNGFIHAEILPQTELHLRWALREYLAVFSPLMPPLGSRLFRGSLPKDYVEWNVGYEDGWVASDAAPHRTDAALAYYRTLFHDNPVSSVMIDELCIIVHDFVTDGIHVYGFRVPTTKSMEALESELGHFDSSRFERQFTSAGGVWLNNSSNQLQTYDGSHLIPESAEIFSRGLAKTLQHAETQVHPGSNQVQVYQ